MVPELRNTSYEQNLIARFAACHRPMCIAVRNGITRRKTSACRAVGFRLWAAQSGYLRGVRCWGTDRLVSP